jgi:hypothetical protein
MHGMDDTLDGMMDVSESHQKQKVVSESVKMGVSVTATALGPLGATVGAAVTPLMGVGGLAATAIGGGINTTVSSGVSLASTTAAHELAGDDLSHVEDEIGDDLEDGSMQDYKTNRALLHFLGYGPRTSPEEMAVHGVEPEQEAARLLLKERMGFDPESDLVGRDQETRSRGRFLPKKYDWLTKVERGWYDKLKNGDVTIGEIPMEYRLAMARPWACRTRPRARPFPSRTWCPSWARWTWKTSRSGTSWRCCPRLRVGTTSTRAWTW